MQNVNKIAITGGSGHLGSCLIQQLLDLNFIVNAQYHTYKPPLNHPNLSWYQGDITDANCIQNLVKDCKIVVHCAGLISVGDKTHEKVYNVNVKGTENVLEACKANPNIRLVHVSSSNAVQEYSDNDVFTENQPYKTASDFSYPYTKALAEQLVLKSVKKHDLDAVIVRPSSIVGPPDYKPSLMGKVIIDFTTKKHPILTSGGYNIVDVRDLSQTIINSFEKGITGEVYLLSGMYLSIKELARLVNERYRPFILPINILITLMPIVHLYRKVFDLKLPITNESLATLKNAPKNMNYSKAKKVLNHHPRSIEETIQDVVVWFKQNSK